ncbi:MaoC family dehydratase [Ornithinimicrobium murale]|uniref:MaoC family dehydratase n=1 Tax=Ornithinimicrobium murale TaxID=1050153 RepID=UPI000E0DF98E|nr:MaoC family dehydratase [Ornithinimicrobium murale]
MKTFDSAQSLLDAVGEELGTSSWLTVDQDRVNAFADATGDHQWIHVDVERAKDGPFGGTIVHGYLTLSLLVPLMKETFQVSGHRMALNYGLDKVRFPAPAPVGSPLRVTTSVHEAREVAGGVQVTWRATVTAEGVDKPVCVAEPVSRYYF